MKPVIPLFFIALSFEAVAAGSLSLSGPTKITQGACAYSPTVVKYTENNQKKDIAVSLKKLSGVTYYSDPLCVSAVTSLTLKKSESYSKNFYIKDTTNNSRTITVSKTSETAVKASMSVKSMYAISVAPPANDNVDSSSALQAAIDQATLATAPKEYSPVGDEVGKITSPQTIVYLPRANYPYRLKGVYLKSNVRLEIDARATIANIKVPNNSTNCSTYIFIDTKNNDDPSVVGIQNASIVGVGVDSSKASLSHNPAKWDLTHSFTIFHNPEAMGCGGESGMPPVMVRNVKGFVLRNIYSIQNNSYPQQIAKNKLMAMMSVVVLKSGLAGKTEVNKVDGSFNDPRNGVYKNHYNINAFSGYGPVQVQSAKNIDFDHFFSLGGVALRLETDYAGGQTNWNACTTKAPCNAKGAKVDAINVNTVECKNGNSALYLVAHYQVNGTVTASNIMANNCYRSIVEGHDKKTGVKLPGKFIPKKIDKVDITGSNYNGNGFKAQQPDPVNDTFTANVRSNLDVAIIDDPENQWGVMPTNCSSRGEFNISQVCP